MPYNNTMNNNMRMPVRPGCPKVMPAADNDCGFRSECIDRFPIAMAYVPWQEWNKVYDPECAIHHGTIFPELSLPFNCASPACRGGRGGRL